ncbi:allatostatin-A receptor-like isoform X2 [Symsagittifera roscoffensis]|uniref:allatostatin-A receptor-like isoform X2 n=1 Tax=Symsagittifera roscoffensis TaxID=84072 RepID=UPI00307B8FF7
MSNKLTSAVQNLSLLEMATNYSYVNLSATAVATGGKIQGKGEGTGTGASAMSGYLFFALYMTEFLIGLLGNSVVLVVLSMSRLKKSPTIAYMLNLSVADLLVCVFVIPPTAYTLCFLNSPWPFGLYYCKFYGMIQTLVVFVSIYTMVLMSLDRFMAVVHPITSMQFRSYEIGKRSSCAVWLVWGLFTLPLTFITDSEGGQCTLAWQLWFHHQTQQERAFKVFVELIFLFGYLVPLLVIVVLYRKLLQSLWQRNDQLPHRHTSQSYERGKRRTTKLVIIVVTMFSACVLPYMLINQLWAWWDNWTQLVSSPEAWVRLCYFLFYVNNICNPFVYTIQSETFRDHLTNTIPRSRRALEWLLRSDPAPVETVALVECTNHHGTSDNNHSGANSHNGNGRPRQASNGCRRNINSNSNSNNNNN